MVPLKLQHDKGVYIAACNTIKAGIFICGYGSLSFQDIKFHLWTPEGGQLIFSHKFIMVATGITQDLKFLMQKNLSL